MDKDKCNKIIGQLTESFQVKPPFYLIRKKLSKGVYGIELCIRSKPVNVGDMTEYISIGYTQYRVKMENVLNALQYLKR